MIASAITKVWRWSSRRVQRNTEGVLESGDEPTAEVYEELAPTYAKGNSYALLSQLRDGKEKRRQNSLTPKATGGRGAFARPQTAEARRSSP
jgi:hypothetical protein